MAAHCSEPPYRLSDEMRGQYEAAFAASNEWVRQRYFPGRVELFPRSWFSADVSEGRLGGGDWDRMSGLIGELFEAKKKL